VDATLTNMIAVKRNLYMNDFQICFSVHLIVYIVYCKAKSVCDRF